MSTRLSEGIPLCMNSFFLSLFAEQNVLCPETLYLVAVRMELFLEMSVIDACEQFRVQLISFVII